MEELTEIRVNDNTIIIKNNLVKSAILPQVTTEINRDVLVQGNCIVEGAVYARNMEIQQGPLEIQGAVFTQVELHVNNDAKGRLKFNKAVGSADSIVSYARGAQLVFMADINAKQVKLVNAYVSGSIFAEEVVLDNCVVIGGVFATKTFDCTDCIVGTFNAPSVNAGKMIYTLLPSAFCLERINALPGTQMFNLSLADLGSLFKGEPQEPNTGKIGISLDSDEMKTVLTSEGTNLVVRSYSVVGKVLAADLLDSDKLNNHFLITAASLGNQLLKVYNLGNDKAGKSIELTIDKLVPFFFDILQGKIQIPIISGNFTMQEITDKYNN